MSKTSPPQASAFNKLLTVLDRNIRFLFPLPAFLIALGLFIYPLFELFRISMCRWELTTTDPRTFVWFANFVQAFIRDTHFWKSVWLMLYFAFASVSVQLVTGFALALMLNREFKGESVVRMLLLFPIIATPVAMSLTWSMMMNPFMGVLNYLFSLIGLGPSEWAANTATVMPALILVEVWHWTPFMMLVLLAGLKSLPKDPYEAAIIDGASRVQVFFKITLPLMQPYIVLVIILRLIHGFRVFDKIFVISGGGPNRASETLNLMIYHEAFAALNYGYASALGVIMLVIIFIISLGIFRYRERDWSY
ncbi:MAG: sugar ABC transporter permease [Deltaproteobacteria bacterium]|nr:sugar ABC transporter permease [Deltaproteobacteria bacterium]